MDRTKSGLTYTADTLFWNGEPVYLWTGEFPYYRVEPSDWGSRLDQVKAAGIRTITAYVPWNLHEYEEGKFDFTGEKTDRRRNLLGFIAEIEKRGMYLIPKPGPFICAEVQHGGIPDFITDGNPRLVMKSWNGDPVGFRQDQKPLPDFLNPAYLDFVKRWYGALCREALGGRQYPEGPVIAAQVGNEFPYSTSELADPFSWGYTPVVERAYRLWSAGRYRTIGAYNRAHGKRMGGFDELRPPVPPQNAVCGDAASLEYRDWVRFKEDYGVSVARTYRELLAGAGLRVPLYHNAGMLEDEAPMNFGPLSDAVWMGVNFWLSAPPAKSFDAYVHGIRRLKQLEGGQTARPPISPELNWGWSQACDADFLTRYTLPFLKSTNIYTVVNGNRAGNLNGRPYTNNPEPYPGTAPIGCAGEAGDGYERLRRLTAYTRSEGEKFAAAKYCAEIGIGYYPPDNELAVYRKWSAEGPRMFEKLPETGANAFLQGLMSAFIRQNIDYRGADIRRQPLEKLAENRALVVRSQKGMDAPTRRKLLEYARAGGILVLLQGIPEGGPAEGPFEGLAARDVPSGEPAPETVRFCGEARDFAVAPFKKTIRIRGNGWAPLLSCGEGSVAGAETAYGEGRIVCFSGYLTNGALYRSLFGRMGLRCSYASCETEEIEVLETADPSREAVYLYVINRSGKKEAAEIDYYDFSAHAPRRLTVPVDARSVFLARVSGGRIASCV